MVKEQYQGISSAYRRREPEKTVLYKVIQQNLETFLVQMREACLDHDPVPDYVENTFRSYLECGILAYGFGRCWCPNCRHGFAVAYSCKTRGLCPSCNSKRMAMTAAHIIDYVMPRVPVRQVVLSVPRRLRWYLHRDPKVVSGVLHVFLRALSTCLRKHSPGAPREAKIGAVSFSHRGGSSLNVHPHFHLVVADGVFADDGNERAAFYAATELSEDVWARLQATLRKRILRYFTRHGYLDEDVAQDMLRLEHDGGFSLHGEVRIDDSDREGQEKLLRYCARPSFSKDRLTWWNEEQQQLLYQFQRPLPDGRTHEILSAMDLMKRLAELIPPPWMNMVRYYGALAPNAKIREQVVNLAGPSEALRYRLQQAADDMGLTPEADADLPDTEATKEKQAPKKRASAAWAMLMARIFEFLPLTCPRCSFPMKTVGFIVESENVRKVLEHLELPTEAPMPHPPRAPPQTEMDFVEEFGDWTE